MLSVTVDMHHAIPTYERTFPNAASVCNVCHGGQAGGNTANRSRHMGHMANQHTSATEAHRIDHAAFGDIIHAPASMRTCGVACRSNKVASGAIWQGAHDGAARLHVGKPMRVGRPWALVVEGDARATEQSGAPHNAHKQQRKRPCNAHSHLYSVTLIHARTWDGKGGWGRFRLGGCAVDCAGQTVAGRPLLCTMPAGPLDYSLLCRMLCVCPSCMCTWPLHAAMD